MGTNLSKENLKRKIDISDSTNIKKFKLQEANNEGDKKEKSLSLQDGLPGFSIDRESRKYFWYLYMFVYFLFSRFESFNWNHQH